jgi:hypothetical protein
VATNDQSTFVKLGPALLAKEIEIRRPLDGMDDSVLLQAIETLTEIMRASAPPAEPEDVELAGTKQTVN